MRRGQAKIAQLLRAIGEELKCPICLSVFGSNAGEDGKPCITTCAHTFCRECLLTALATKRPGQQQALSNCCPLCKSAVSKRSLCTDERMAAVAGAFMRLRQAYETTFHTPFSQAPVMFGYNQRGSQPRLDGRNRGGGQDGFADDLSQRFPYPIKPTVDYTRQPLLAASINAPVKAKRKRKSEKFNRSESTVVLMTSGLIAADRELVQRVCRQFGWQFCLNRRPDCPITHLIMQPTNGGAAVRRTLKYLQALTDHAWVCSMDWILQCRENQCRMNELRFEVDGDLNYPTAQAPRVSRLNATGKLLLDSCPCLILSPAESYQSIEIESIRELAIQCGALIVRTVDDCENRDASDSNFPTGNQSSIIILCGIEAVAEQVAELASKFSSYPNISIRSVMWLLDCIALQDPHLLAAPYEEILKGMK